MIAKLHASGKSFRGVVSYCLGEGRLDREPGERLSSPDSSRVEWTETVNLATDDPLQAGRQMAATREYAGELKRLSGLGAGGRKLEKPVAHYSLSWAEGEAPDRQEQIAAVESSMKVLDLSDRQALVVSHNDGRTPHVHVIANRVSAEDGRAAGLSQGRLKLSRWAESYERERGKIHCQRRVEHNQARSQGEYVKERTLESDARFRRLPAVDPKQAPQSAEAERIEKAVDSQDTGVLDEYEGLNGAMRRLVSLKKEQEESRRKEKRDLDGKHRGEWSKLYQRQEGERAKQEEDCQSVRGRVKQWREQGRRWWELAGAIRGKPAVVEGWERSLERSHREERAGLGRDQGREVRELGVFRPRQLGYREARFEEINRIRKFVAGMYEYRPDLGYGENACRRKVAEESRGRLEAKIRALPESDRKELERRDREHPPPVLPQQKPSHTPKEDRGDQWSRSF